MDKKAVLTGDIINSRKVVNKALLLSTMQNLFNELSKQFSIENQFEIYRGDSFQALVSNPKKSLRLAILIRTGLLKESPLGEIWDTRVGIGIGEVSFLQKNIKISNGAAFELSGRALDDIKRSERRTHIQSADTTLNKQLEILNTLTDAIVNRWSKNASEVIYRQLLYGETQKEIGKKLNISQSAVQQRFASANFDAINAYISYFEKNLTLNT